MSRNSRRPYVDHTRSERDLQAHTSTGPLVVPPEVDMKELQALLAEVQTAIRDGHALLRDLRVESRQARRILPMIVTKRIQAEVTKQLAELGVETEKAIRAAVARVDKTFNDFSDILLGTDHQSRKEDRRSVPEIVDILAGRIEHAKPKS